MTEMTEAIMVNCEQEVTVDMVTDRTGQDKQ